MDNSLLDPKMIFDGVVREFTFIPGTRYYELPECPLSELGNSSIYLRHEKAVILTTLTKMVLLSVGKVVLLDEDSLPLDCTLLINEISLDNSGVKEQILGFLQDKSLFHESALYGYKSGYIGMNEDLIVHDSTRLLLGSQNREIKELMPCYSDSLEEENLTFRLEYIPKLYKEEFVYKFSNELKAFIKSCWGKFNVAKNMSCSK